MNTMKRQQREAPISHEEIEKMLDINNIINDYIGKKKQPHEPTPTLRQPRIPKPLLVFDLNLHKTQTCLPSSGNNIKGEGQTYDYPHRPNNKHITSPSHYHSSLNPNVSTSQQSTQNQQERRSNTHSNKSRSHTTLSIKQQKDSKRQTNIKPGGLSVPYRRTGSAKLHNRELSLAGRKENTSKTTHLHTLSHNTNEKQYENTEPTVTLDVPDVSNNNKKQSALQHSNMVSLDAHMLSRQRRAHYSVQSMKKKAPLLLKNRYQLLNVIGRGHFSTVQKARDTLTNSFVAIKMIHQDQNFSSAAAAATTNQPGLQIKLFKYLMHPNIVRLLNSFVQDSKQYLVLQYIPDTLTSYLSKNRVSMLEIKKIFKELCKAIAHLHSQNIVHRDIKMENIMVQQVITHDENLKKVSRTNVKIIDFGLATKCTTVDAEGGMSQILFKEFCGTPNYVAPEILTGEGYLGKPADCWALGVVLYSLLVGRMPFKAKEEPELYRKIKRGKVCFGSDMEEKGKNLINKLLVMEPGQRYSVNKILLDEWLEEVVEV